jgi:putative ABC transport system permease protein
MPQTLVTLAIRNLRRQPRRSALAIGAVTFGIVALMLASGFIEWIFFDMRESTIHSQIGHLQVVRPGYLEAGPSDHTTYLLPSGAVELESLTRERDVLVVAARLSFSGLASHGETTMSFLGEGVDPAHEAQLSKSLEIVDGQRLPLDNADSVLLGVGLAANLNAKVGDVIVLMVNKPSGGLSAMELRVSGLFATITKAYDDAALRLPIESARRLMGLQGAHRWIILVDRTSSTDRVADSLGDKLPRDRFQVVRWYELADFYRKTVALFSRQVQVVKIIIAAIIALGIGNTLTMCVMERTGEIGTSMALGIPRRTILAQFLTEGILLGVIGGALGVAVGALLASLISQIGIPMPPPPGMGHGFIGQIRITPGLAAEAFLLAVAATLLAGTYPAWKASRLVIVDALRSSR